MKLYRYELYCDEELQDVGFLVGLQDLGLSSAVEESLLPPFDFLLKIPDLPGMQGSVSFFTEEGNTRFQKHIVQVASAFQDSIFDIKCCFLDLPVSYLDKVIYQDDDQVCIPKDLYLGELMPLVSRESYPRKESLDYCGLSVDENVSRCSLDAQIKSAFSRTGDVHLSSDTPVKTPNPER